jgi:hypothetical protein
MKSPATVTRTELDEVVAQWRDARAARLELQKQVDKIQELESQLKQFIIDSVHAQKFEGLVFGGRVTTVTEKETRIVTDKEALLGYIFEHKAIDLLQFRLAPKAVALREADGIEVPGVGVMTSFDLSDKKL